MNSYILENLDESYYTFKAIKEDKNIIEQINIISNICYQCLLKGKKILIAGNGGSACDSQHFAGELVGRFKLERKGLAAISLSDSNSAITAIANDYGYEYIFSRQIEAIGEKGDILIVFSTSGNSKNIINGVKVANEMGIKTIGFTGKTGGEIIKYCDPTIKIPSNETARIQEGHILIIHVICGIIERYFCK
mgnify:CR=1 FL=1